MTPTKKDGEKRDLSAISEVVTGEHTANSYKCTHGVGFKERALQALKKNLEMSMKEMELQMCTLTSGSTKLSESEEREMSHSTPKCGCPGHSMRMKIHQTSLIHWVSMYLLPLRKIYSQYG